MALSDRLPSREFFSKNLQETAGDPSHAENRITHSDKVLGFAILPLERTEEDTDVETDAHEAVNSDFATFGVNAERIEIESLAGRRQPRGLDGADLGDVNVLARRLWKFS